MWIPHSVRFGELLSGSFLKIFFTLFLLVLLELPLWSQEKAKQMKVKVTYDTIIVKKGNGFKYKGKTYKITKDTVFILSSIENSTVNVNSVKRSDIFYDSVYKKFSRRKFSRLLYQLAFKPRDMEPLPGYSHKIKSEIPFEKYKGKVIRHIRIQTMDPFGTSIYDTAVSGQNSVGKALNATHIKTRSWVIHQNLFIREGQTVDPFLLADNERNIRQMSSIDDVKTYVSLSSPSSDSVDITIVTKDVFSIGGAVLTASLNTLALRAYDGNFLGLADRLSTNFSFETKRQPLFRIDGVSYSYDNIGGTFLSTLISYNQDDVGNQAVGISLSRNFYSINTKWAFGAGYQYNKMVIQKQSISDITVLVTETSFYNDMSLWGGRAFKINNSSIPTRFVITEALFRRSFTSRPSISIDSNKSYYNTLRFLTGFALSSNNYYLTDYILHFGKPELIPYGRVFKLTLGPEITDYYTRLYSSVDVSAGDFISGFGYLSGRALLGGYIYHRSAEDCVLKLSLKYLSSLLVTRNNKFKFRNYFSADFRYGFNFRKNNLDYSNINHDFLINQVRFDTVFYGIKSLSATLSVIMYTPIYLYGFRFAFMAQGKGGFVAHSGEALFNQLFCTGLGFGILIRNDNLIFPPILISCFYYPSIPTGVAWWQFGFNQNTGIALPDYNVTMPQTEALQY
jgi:hypothetical protein